MITSTIDLRSANVMASRSDLTARSLAPTPTARKSRATMYLSRREEDRKGFNRFHLRKPILLAPQTRRRSSIRAGKRLIPVSFQSIPRKNQAWARFVTLGLHLLPSGFHLIPHQSRAQMSLVTSSLHLMLSSCRFILRESRAQARSPRPGLQLISFRMIPCYGWAQARYLNPGTYFIPSGFQIPCWSRAQITLRAPRLHLMPPGF